MHDRVSEWVVNDGALCPVITHPSAYAFAALLRMAVRTHAWITAVANAQVRERKALRAVVKGMERECEASASAEKKLGRKRKVRECDSYPKHLWCPTCRAGHRGVPRASSQRRGESNRARRNINDEPAASICRTAHAKCNR